MNSKQSRWTLNLARVVHVGITIILIGANILLINENWRLGRALDESKKYVTDVGYRFGSLTSFSLDGSEELLTFSQEEKSTILLVFRSTCTYCIQQYPYWREITERIDRSKYRIIAITSEHDRSLIRQHVEQNGLRDLEIRILSLEDVKAARLMLTPMTLVIDTSGTVTKVWPGLWTKGFDFST